MATEDVVRFTREETRAVQRLVDATTVNEVANFRPAPSPTVSQYKTYYYSGGQAQIYMEDIFIDELFALQFSTVTNKTPIYGYSSKRFDTVADGNLLVTGSFTVNFVNANYMSILSKYLQGNKAELERSRAGRLRPAGDQTLVQAANNPSALSPFELTQALNQIRGLGNKEFRELQSAIQELNVIEVEHDMFYDIPPFDVFAVFGDETDPNANHTLRKIIDVYLTAQAQVVNSSGEVRQEQFSFIARDIE